MLPSFLVLAQLSQALLIACARGLPRVRVFLVASMVTDWIRLGLFRLPISRALLALDGALLLTPACCLAWALKVDCRPSVAFALASLMMAHGLGYRGATLERFYLLACIVIGVGVLIAAFPRTRLQRQEADRAVLLGLAVEGSIGALVAVVWPDWTQVQVANLSAYVVLGAFCLLRQRGK